MALLGTVVKERALATTMRLVIQKQELAVARLDGQACTVKNFVQMDISVLGVSKNAIVNEQEMKQVKSVTMLLESVIAHLGLLERIANNHVLKDSGGKDAAKYVIA